MVEDRSPNASSCSYVTMGPWPVSDFGSYGVNSCLTGASGGLTISISLIACARSGVILVYFMSMSSVSLAPCLLFALIFFTLCIPFL